MMSPMVSENRMRSVFANLPEFEPDPDLWGRIHSANLRRVRLRRIRRTSAVGAVFLVFAITGLLGFPRGLITRSDTQSSSDWQAHSQDLQDQWSMRTDRNVDPHIQARLRLLDSDLQAAYDRGASEPELAPLWSMRSRLLQSLVQSNAGQSRRLTRI